jgi:nicotinamide-nucleotide amidase
MKASVLTIGDELLIGQVINSNAAWIAEQLALLGVTLVRHVTCSDDDIEIERCLREESRSVDVLIVTGGLGPTHDDRTKHVLASWYECELVESEEAYRNLVSVLAARGRAEILDRNREQARVPSLCSVLMNRHGTAPGMLFDRNGLLLVSLPGVPSEMKAMMTDDVLPFIQKRLKEQGDTIMRYRTIHTIGIAEAYLAEQLEPLQDILDEHSTLAFLPNVSGVRLRIGVQATDDEQAGYRLDAIAGRIYNRLDHSAIFGEGNTTLAAEVVAALMRRSETVAVAESCTAGLLGAAITDIAGSSSVFPGGIISYANEVKNRELGVPMEILETYGAVSDQCARAMARGIRERLDATYGISVTGIAGPDGGTSEKPVGTVWIAVATPNGVSSKVYRFGSERLTNRQRSVNMALAMLWQVMGEHDV